MSPYDMLNGNNASNVLVFDVDGYQAFICMNISYQQVRALRSLFT